MTPWHSGNGRDSQRPRTSSAQADVLLEPSTSTGTALYRIGGDATEEAFAFTKASGRFWEDIAQLEMSLIQYVSIAFRGDKGGN